MNNEKLNLYATTDYQEGLEMLLSLDKIALPEWRYGYTLALMGFSTDEAIQIIIRLNEVRRNHVEESNTKH